MQVLLEVLVGMGLFASAVLLILIYLPSNDRAAVATDQMTQATQLCRTLLDTVLDQDYTQVNSYTGFKDVNHAERRGSQLLVRFTYDVTATALGGKLKDVVVTVSWTQQGRASQVKLRGRKCDYW